MYLPRHFTEERVPVLHDAIRQARLGTLVTLGEAGLEASHVPMLIDPEPAPYGTLRGHVSRANPQWRRPAAGVQALAMFLGPDAYISPAWYATKRQTGKVVPTWNYLTVHAYGPLRSFEDPERLTAHVERLTATHDSEWRLSDAPADYVEGMVKGIVGLELPITRLEGKWKMSQNRPEADQLGAIAGLEAAGGAAEQAVAQVMRALHT